MRNVVETVKVNIYTHTSIKREKTTKNDIYVWRICIDPPKATSKLLISVPEQKYICMCVKRENVKRYEKRTLLDFRSQIIP